PVSHSLAPTFMKIFFIMRLPWAQPLFSLQSQKNLSTLGNSIIKGNQNERLTPIKFKVMKGGYGGNIYQNVKIYPHNL
ncbi:MAG: hypothetical protein KIG83_08535, partial [Treponema sp.]|nr:hypothetical protein [Treponema sp.]